MSILLRILIGGLGGLSATAPMTITMALLHRKLPIQDHYPLPPREITMKLAKFANADRRMNADAKALVTLLNHFGYGAIGGIIYAIFFERISGSAFARGNLFAVIVWLASYLGIMPALGILKSAEKHPASRNALMLVAHLVWGTMLSLFTEIMFKERHRMDGALLAKSLLPLKDVN